MPVNSKRPSPLPTSLSKQSSATNTKKVTSKPTNRPDTNDGKTGATRSRVLAPRSPSVELTWDTTGKEVTDKATTEPATVPTSSVNRKKQKRRQKQAARLAAERQLSDGYPPADVMKQNGHVHYVHGPRDDASHENKEHNTSAGNSNYVDPDFEVANHYEPGDIYYSDDESRLYAKSRSKEQRDNNGSTGQNHEIGSRKTKKKRKKKNRPSSHHLAEESSTSLSTPSTSVVRPPPPPPPPLSNAALRSAHKISKDRIWNTSTQEERENIKEFWLQLGEEERRSLVKVEKEAVLRKMKEQQKHSCSCTVCGRKRTAIEEELEVLYDAYYEELEQYANHNQGSFENGAPIVPPPRLYQPHLRSLDRHAQLPGAQHPARGRVRELPDDDDLDEDYDEDDEDDEPYSDDELEEATRATRADFFAFGNSLTVKGMIVLSPLDGPCGLERLTVDQMVSLR